MTPDFFALPRPPRPTETFTASGGGQSAQLTLRAMDLLDMHRMITLRDRMVERYVPFAYRRRMPEGDALEPIDFPPVGGEPVLLSEETCEACATLVVMQPEVEHRFEALVAIAATSPELFQAISHRAAALNRRSAGKAEGESTSGSSTPASPGV